MNSGFLLALISPSYKPGFTTQATKTENLYQPAMYFMGFLPLGSMLSAMVKW